MDLLLAAYADGVVMAEDRQDVEAHLRTCAPCRQALAVQQAMRDALSAHSGAVSVPAPPGLATRVAAAMAAERSPRPMAGWAVDMSAFAAAAVLVLALSAVALPLITGRSSVVLAAQLALDHLKCFLIEPHDHGESVSVAEAEAELARDYGWDLEVPETAGDPSGRLVAVRRCLYGDGRAAHLLYSVDDQPVSLFILPGLERPQASFSVMGQAEVVWTQQGRTYMLVGDSALGSRLQTMATTLRNEAQ
jgi:anti-sigma factor RsiW